MAKCIDCAWFPWKTGADFSMLPVAKCHPSLKARRWPGGSATTDHDCPYYVSREYEQQADPDADALRDMTVAKLKSYIETVTDPLEIEALIEAELQRENPRTTALKTLEDRLEELREGQSEPEGDQGGMSDGTDSGASE